MTQVEAFEKTIFHVLLVLGFGKNVKISKIQTEWSLSRTLVKTQIFAAEWNKYWDFLCSINRKKLFPFFDQFEFRHFQPGLAQYLAEISVGRFPRLFNKNEPCFLKSRTTFIILFIIYLYLLYLHIHTYWSYFIQFHIHYYTIQYYYIDILIHREFLQRF